MVTDISLEQVLDKGQVSEEEIQEENQGEVTEEVPEEVTEEKPDKKLDLTPENFEARVKAEAQSRSDKLINEHREKREADTAYIRSQAERIKELTVTINERKLSKAMEAVMEGDEEEGVEADKIEARRKGFEEIKTTLKEYNGKVEEVEEVAALASNFAEKVDKRVADNFNLFDSNPAIRAKGAINVISDAIYYIGERKAWTRILDEIPLLQKGEEVRKQIDSFVERYMELSDEKGRDLLIDRLKQELRVTPRRKPPTPSDTSGGLDYSKLTPEEKIDMGWKKLKSINRR